jgi:2-methylisocitrate lyase-like PEP mutase family enzyme
LTAGAPARLRGLLAGPEPVVAPGAYDALSALLAEQAGFGAVYMTGFGNPINVMRTIREYEAAGVAALHIEDQVAPKRCGHMEGKDVIAASEMVEKVRAAVESRTRDVVIIARTDARAVEGLDGALERARRYRDAGADVLFVEAPESEREVEIVAEAFPGTPLLFNARSRAARAADRARPPARARLPARSSPR